jgi:predicted DNA-binding helix-hairpin-helix protein
MEEKYIIGLLKKISSIIETNKDKLSKITNEIVKNTNDIVKRLKHIKKSINESTTTKQHVQHVQHTKVYLPL